MSKLERQGDALMIVGSKSHEPGQTAFADLGCSAACEEEKDCLRKRVLELESRNKILEMYLTRYSNQETDLFLGELKETKEQLRRFQRHLKANPRLLEWFENYCQSEIVKDGKGWASMQGALQWIRKNFPGQLKGDDDDGKYEEFMLPLYSRYILERNPAFVGKIELRKSRFDGYRPWVEEYGENDE